MMDNLLSNIIVASDQPGHANIPVEFKPHRVCSVRVVEITLPLRQVFVAFKPKGIIADLKGDGIEINHGDGMPCVQQGQDHGSTIGAVWVALVNVLPSYFDDFYPLILWRPW